MPPANAPNLILTVVTTIPFLRIAVPSSGPPANPIS